MTACTGRILQFDDMRGFGFIGADDGGEDVFLHASVFGGDSVDLVPGARVEFQIMEGDRGRKAFAVQLAAEPVRIADQPKPPAQPRPPAEMDITAIDHIEFYVDDAEQAAAHLCDYYGFAVHGRGGPDAGQGGCRAVLLRQQEITLLVTSALSDDHHVAEYVRRHGDGVAVIGLTVEDAHAAFAEAVERGAASVLPPVVLGDRGSRVTFASVLGFGDVEHRFTSREAPGGPFAPGLIGEIAPLPVRDGLLEAVDHIAVCLRAGTLDATVEHYHDVFGFSQTFQEQIVVGCQRMDSKVVQSASGRVTLTLVEPDTTYDPGQIDEFLHSHGGAGVQHVAFLTKDIRAAVRCASEGGVRFLTTPSAYYETLTPRVGPVGVPVEALQELSILADRDGSGVMFQIFTESRHPRRTLFYELIERRGARTFGSNNIKALYEAVERQRAIDRVPGI